MTADPVQQRAELDQLQSELASRESITHFARTAVSTTVALLLGGGVAKLFVDSTRTPYLAWGGTVVVLGVVVFATVQYVRGRRAMKSENERIERMLALRRELRLDDPSALLPG
jgi:hypothetical protein